MPNPSELERQEQENQSVTDMVLGDQENVKLGAPCNDEATGFELYTHRELAQALRKQVWQSPANEEAARRLEKLNGR